MRWEEMTVDEMRWEEIIWDEMTVDEMRGDDSRWDERRWEEIIWDEMTVDEMRWDEMTVDEMRGDDSRWDEMRGDNMRWDDSRWAEMRWEEERRDEMRGDEIRWGEMKWGEMRWQKSSVSGVWGRRSKEGGSDQKRRIIQYSGQEPVCNASLMQPIHAMYDWSCLWMQGMTGPAYICKVCTWGRLAWELNWLTEVTRVDQNKDPTTRHMLVM
jgi:hypothetical protein